MRIIDWCSDLCSSDLRSNIPGERKLLISHVDAKPISDVGAIGDLKFGDPFEPGTNEHLQLHPRKECAYTQVDRSEEHTSELQSLMRISYAVFCLKTKTQIPNNMSLTEYNINTIYTHSTKK